MLPTSGHTPVLFIQVHFVTVHPGLIEPGSTGYLPTSAHYSVTVSDPRCLHQTCHVTRRPVTSSARRADGCWRQPNVGGTVVGRVGRCRPRPSGLLTLFTDRGRCVLFVSGAPFSAAGSDVNYAQRGGGLREGMRDALTTMMV